MNPTHQDTAVLPRREHLVAVLVYEGVKLLDVAGPIDVFTEANRLGTDYRVVLVSEDGESVRTSSGVRLAVDHTPSSLPAPDTFLVAGSDVHPRATIPHGLAETATMIAGRSARTASICTGAFILAAAGLLDGRRATTHWKVTPLLASRYPSITVDADAIFVRDGAVTTSAGVSAGIDLALAFLEEDHGAPLAREVARMLVVYLQRPGGQSQFSAALAGPPPRTPALRTLTDQVTADPTGDHSLTRLAEQLALSPRHLTRLFREELDTTPARFVESIRLDRARALLDDGCTATDTATRSGFPSYESMRRVFVRELGIAPGAYQRRFRTARDRDRPSVPLS